VEPTSTGNARRRGAREFKFPAYPSRHLSASPHKQLILKKL
jgi:hypothetical protein